MRLKFQGRKHPDISIGGEFQLIDENTLLPLSRAEEVVRMLNLPHVRVGMFQSVIVIETEFHPTVSESMVEFHKLLHQTILACRKVGGLLLSSGTHPFAHWQDLRPSPKPIVRKILERLRWVGERMAIFGLRLNVGVPNGEEAIAISSAFRNLIPLFVALSASSPFWQGSDTGLASVRTRIIENVPNAGIPPRFVNWAEFVNFMKTLRSAEAIGDVKELWWDIQPWMQAGAIRLRACDMPHTVQEIAILAALAQSVVYTLIDYYQRGEIIFEQRHFIIRENKWRAARWGMEAHFIQSIRGDTIPMRAVLDLTLERIAPVAKSLGVEKLLQDIEILLSLGPGYVRQKMYYQSFLKKLEEELPGVERKELEQEAKKRLVRHLVRELESGTVIPFERGGV